MIAAMGACNSLFMIAGSWLADHVLGPLRALIIGNMVKGTGFLLLAFPHFSLEQGRLFAFLDVYKRQASGSCGTGSDAQGVWLCR